MDPFSVASVSLPPLWSILRRAAGRNNIVSAFFDARGSRLLGDDRLSVTVIQDDGDASVWYFMVNDLDDYVFTRAAVSADAAHELYGIEQGSSNPDPRFFRWVAPTVPGVIYGGGTSRPNALVPFIVVGYQPKVLVRELTANE